LGPQTLDFFLPPGLDRPSPDFSQPQPFSLALGLLSSFVPCAGYGVHRLFFFFCKDYNGADPLFRTVLRRFQALSFGQGLRLDFFFSSFTIPPPFFLVNARPSPVRAFPFFFFQRGNGRCPLMAPFAAKNFPLFPMSDKVPAHPPSLECGCFFFLR